MSQIIKLLANHRLFLTQDASLLPTVELIFVTEQIEYELTGLEHDESGKPVMGTRKAPVAKTVRLNIHPEELPSLAAHLLQIHEQSKTFLPPEVLKGTSEEEDDE